MPRARITNRLVEGIKPTDQDQTIFDTDVTGFGVKVTPSGRRSYFFLYRVGGGRSGKQRKPSIGIHGQLNAEQARAIARQWAHDVRLGKDPSLERQQHRAAPTMDDLCARYLTDHAAVRKKARSYDSDKQYVGKIVVPHLGGLRAAEVTRADIVRMHHRLARTPYQANRVLALLSKMFNLAEKWGYRPDGSNPTKHVEKYPERPRQRFLSGDEVARLTACLDLDRASQPYHVALIELLLLTGARLSEIRTARWDQLDIARQQLRLADSKTGPRTIFLNDSAMAVLAWVPQVSGNPYIIVGAKPDEELKNVQKWWRQLRSRAGLRDLRIHDLRHTFASFAVSAGMSLPVVGKLLGHSQPATTARYAHLGDDATRAAAQTVGQLVGACLTTKTQG